MIEDHAGGLAGVPRRELANSATADRIDEGMRSTRLFVGCGASAGLLKVSEAVRSGHEKVVIRGRTTLLGWGFGFPVRLRAEKTSQLAAELAPPREPGSMVAPIVLLSITGFALLVALNMMLHRCR